VRLLKPPDSRPEDTLKRIKVGDTFNPRLFANVSELLGYLERSHLPPVNHYVIWEDLAEIAGRAPDGFVLNLIDSIMQDYRHLTHRGNPDGCLPYAGYIEPPLLMWLGGKSPLQALKRLESKGFITITRNEDGAPSYIKYNDDCVELAIKALGQVPLKRIKKATQEWRKPIRPKLKFSVLARDNFRCCYCGRKPPEVVLELDHVIPGGPTTEENLKTACRECNIGKGNRNVAWQSNSTGI